ncbi:flavodoxin [Longilinea arvoryzae]|uniref:Flavodoxin n=1 Tax=Longilinea arvoryzae TaxID=360412 RepID=A0A0K8MXX5_9CHLR|nr:flavodoxin domain-containing protein [Longilinea arvoryzae]GAP16060.1 flavodoxin [Longilinea arvoryzae]
MSKILITYSTNSGSTAEVAAAIAAELNQAGHTAEVKPIAQAADLSAYDAVVIGAPMIFGWQAAARSFLKRHAAELAPKKVALFACAMRLTRVPAEPLPAVPLMLDPNLVSEPLKPGSLTLKERFTSLGYYLKPMLAAAPSVRPLSVAFFNGQLDMRRLKWWQAAFVMIVVQAVPGDYRDWEYIRAWAKAVGERL